MEDSKIVVEAQTGLGFLLGRMEQPCHGYHEELRLVGLFSLDHKTVLPLPGRLWPRR